MNRSDAYAILSRELAKYQQLGYERLASMIGQPPCQFEEIANDETVVIEIRTLWNDPKEVGIRIEATAYGPSTWRFERLDEAIIVMPESSAQ
jgi:hypothetical protein